MIFSLYLIASYCGRTYKPPLAPTVISGFILVIMLVCLVIVHTNFHSLVAERNAVQMTLDEYRKNVHLSMLEKVGAIQQAFEINKEIGVAKYWHNNIWTGAFWPDSVEDLDYIK